MRLSYLKLGFSFLLALFLILSFSSLALSASDPYEPDDDYTQATTLTPDGTLYSHTFDPLGDEDWHKFEATAGVYYTIETLNIGGAETYLELYDTDGVTILEEAYPWSGREWGAAMINWQCPADGTYYIRVVDYWEEGGSYDVRVTECGSISGKVTDEAGLVSLDMVNVYLYTSEGFDFFGMGYTDSDGEYIIERVPVGDYRVEFDPFEHNLYYDSDFLSEYYNNWHGNFEGADIVSVGNGEAVTGIDAQLEVGSRVYGTVKNSSGVPLEDIDVFVYNDDNWFWGPSTNEPINNYVVHGVPTGTYWVYFDPYFYNEDNDTDYLFEWYNNKRKKNLANTITITSNGTWLGGINATLEVGSRIQGVIKDQAGNLLPWVSVELETDDYSWFSGSSSDDTGEYVIRGVPGDYYRMYFDPVELNDAYHLDYLPEWYNNKRRSQDANLVYVGSTPSVVKINPVLERAARVYGTVTGEWWEPLENVTVYLYDIDYMFEGMSVTNEAGDYLLSDPWITDGYHKIFFDTSEHNNIFENDYIAEWYGGGQTFEAATPVELKAGLYKRLDMELTEGGRVYGYVTDATGTIPLGNTWVQLHSDEYDYWSPGTYVHTLGEYVIHGIAPGEYAIYADPWFYNYQNDTNYIAEWYDKKYSYKLADRVLVDYGDSIQINFGLDIGGSIEGTVTAANPGTLGDVVVSVVNGDREEVAYELTDSNGHYKIRGLPPGNYKVKFDPIFYNFFYDADFAPEWYDDQPNFGEATVVTVTAGSAVSGIDATLDHGGRVTGTLKGEDGKGLAGWASISFYSLDDPLTPALSFWSDDELNWTARGVPLGNYRVFFDITDYNHYQGGDYISEWYNDAATFSLATTITVDSTTSIVTGINGVLEKLGKVASTGLKADVNGDGKADMVVLYDKGHQTSSLWVFLSNGSKFTPKIFWSSSPGGWDATRTKITAGDVNHDGKADIIALYNLRYKTSALYAFISSGSKFTPKLFWKSSVGSFDFYRTKLSSGDVNKDGKSDAIVLYDYAEYPVSGVKRNPTSGLFAFISSGSKFTPKLFWKSGVGAFDFTRSKLTSGDVNKDGKSDAIILYDRGSKTSALYAFISSGSSFTQKRFWLSSAGAFDFSRSKLSSGDVNRDGRTDAIVLYDRGSKTSALYAFISSGSSFTQKRFWLSSAGGFDARRATLSAGDVNGDGRADVITLFNYGSNTSGLRCFLSSGSSFGSPVLFWKSLTGKFNYYSSNLAP